MKEILEKIVSGIKADSPNSSYFYTETVEYKLFGSVLYCSVLFKNPALGISSIFTRTYDIPTIEEYTDLDNNKYRISFMIDLLSELLKIKND